MDSIDLTPRHKRLTHKAARDALKRIVDFKKFHVTFVSAKGALGWLLRPLTVRGQHQALGAVPVEIRLNVNRVAAVIGRLADGRIPIRLDSRLLRNISSLKAVVRHEIAEINAILTIEGQFMKPRDLQLFLEWADDLGYSSE